MEIKIKTQKTSIDQKLSPKKFHAKFPSLKNVQKALTDVTQNNHVMPLHCHSHCKFYTY